MGKLKDREYKLYRKSKDLNLIEGKIASQLRYFRRMGYADIIIAQRIFQFCVKHRKEICMDVFEPEREQIELCKCEKPQDPTGWNRCEVCKRVILNKSPNKDASFSPQGLKIGDR